MGIRSFTVASHADIARRSGVSVIKFKVSGDGHGNVNAPVNAVLTEGNPPQPKRGEGLMVRWDTSDGSAVEHFRLFEAMPAAVFNAAAPPTDAGKMVLRINKMVEWMRVDAKIDA